VQSCVGAYFCASVRPSVRPSVSARVRVPIACAPVCAPVWHVRLRPRTGHRQFRTVIPRAAQRFKRRFSNLQILGSGLRVPEFFFVAEPRRRGAVTRPRRARRSCAPPACVRAYGVRSPADEVPLRRRTGCTSFRTARPRTGHTREEGGRRRGTSNKAELEKLKVRSACRSNSRTDAREGVGVGATLPYR
jgi:hypothetical protein